jgi:hypothetical protein
VHAIAKGIDYFHDKAILGLKDILFFGHPFKRGDLELNAELGPGLLLRGRM